MSGRDFTIRRGRREDAAEAARLWVQSAEEHAGYDPVYASAPNAGRMMRRFLADLASTSHSFLFIAVTGADTTEEKDTTEEIIGFVSGELREGSPAFDSRTWASVEDIYVTPEYRSAGVGRALIDHARSWAKGKGSDGLSLQVAAANDRARKFYQELGFREVSVYELLEF